MLHALITLGLAFSTALPVVEPTDDLVITESTRIKAGEYVIPDAGEPGVIRVEGEGVVLVLEGVVIRGVKEDQAPDTFIGTGLLIKGSAHIVHGGAFHGYKVGVKVDGGEGHWLRGLDVGRNFAQKLKSTPAAEDPSDWLRPHKNDDGEWAASYGAGIWVRNAKDVRVLSCIGHNSQNGVILDRTTGSLVKGCDFSYNSGWGLALWRSSDNRIEDNVFNWCVRGYSHGVYDRGQDSAGILVFEQSSRNTITRNSATHGGDGFFLYAGHETTKETGKGGCNDNVVTLNDFSHAVANGIEATFSTGNRFAQNRLEDCNYGIWAGYSRQSEFTDNVIRDCTHAGVAIEHGSENTIRGNSIENCKRGVRLWWDEDQEFLESVYGQNSRTDSADTLVAGNVITGGETAIELAASARIRLKGNFVTGAKQALKKMGECPELEDAPADQAPKLAVPTYPDEPEAIRGRRYIIVHEWGPYDFTVPLLSPAYVEGGRSAVFHLLGVPGGLKLADRVGDVEVSVEIEPGRGVALRVTPKEDAAALLPFSFKVLVGDRELPAAGTLLNTIWKARYWQWEKDPREDPEAWSAMLETDPIRTQRLRRLDLRFDSGGPGGGIAVDRFATVAETELLLPAGEYEITTVSDDGIRVFLNDEEILSNWTHHAPAEDTARFTVGAGKHRIRVEHFEIDGHARLSFSLRRVPKAE